MARRIVVNSGGFPLLVLQGWVCEYERNGNRLKAKRTKATGLRNKQLGDSGESLAE